MKSLLQLALLAFILSLSGCSWFGADSAPTGAGGGLKPVQQSSDSAPSAVKVEPLKSPGENAIEIIWELPKDPVDSYVLKYGFVPDKLDSLVTLKTADIERYEDPRFGFVYRYFLTSVPSDKKVFLTISMVRGNQVSAPSEVMEVPPAPKGAGQLPIVRAIKRS